MEEGREENRNEGEDAGKGLSKDEILARSRKENEKGDEREQAKWRWATYSGYLASVVTVSIIILIYVLLHKSEDYVYPLMVLMGTAMSAQFTCQAIIMRKGKGKTIMIVCSAVIILATIGQWIMFGLALAGIEF